jgi:Icc-related predicted phosphoesterase
LNYSVQCRICKYPTIAVLWVNRLAENYFLRQNEWTVKILAISDQVIDRLYTLSSSGHFQDVQLILGCGDLPYAYLEYLVTMLNVPMFYVPGNHDPRFDLRTAQSHASGGSNLDLKIVRHNKFLIGGFGGSIRYRPDGINQYSQSEAYTRAFSMLPRLFLNRMQYGRALDVLISHSPPFGIHDDSDPAHNGLKALNWLIRIAKPRYLFHGHTHFYKRNLSNPETTIGITKIMNVYPYKTIEVSH